MQAVDKKRTNKIILLAGPGGSGKTTIAELLRDKYGYVLIDGDQLDTEFFPGGGQWLPENKENLKKAHKKILAKTKDEFDAGKNVVVDYIIFGEYADFINEFKDAFGDYFQIKVLFPSEEETIQRDEKRQCWTTGEERIRAVRNELIGAKQYIGEENFIDTSGLGLDESLEKLLS